MNVWFASVNLRMSATLPYRKIQNAPIFFIRHVLDFGVKTMTNARFVDMAGQLFKLCEYGWKSWRGLRIQTAPNSSLHETPHMAFNFIIWAAANIFKLKRNEHEFCGKIHFKNLTWANSEQHRDTCIFQIIYDTMCNFMNLNNEIIYVD